jgi:hypothetical protein
VHNRLTSNFSTEYWLIDQFTAVSSILTMPLLQCAGRLSHWPWRCQFFEVSFAPTPRSLGHAGTISCAGSVAHRTALANGNAETGECRNSFSSWLPAAYCLSGCGAVEVVVLPEPARVPNKSAADFVIDRF